jgi:hypothetical protein
MFKVMDKLSSPGLLPRYFSFFLIGEVGGEGKIIVAGPVAGTMLVSLGASTSLFFLFLGGPLQQHKIT